MNAKLKTFFISILCLGFVGISVCLFLARFPVLPLFSLYFIVVLACLSLDNSPVAFMMTGFSTLLAIFSFNKVPEALSLILPILVLALWGSAFLVHMHLDTFRGRRKSFRDKQGDVVRKNKALKKEIDYYLSRKEELSVRASLRRQLSVSARELGSLLEPAAILQKLIESAQKLFPGRQVHVSYGQTPDAVDRYIIQRRQPVLVPSDLFKGNPMMAVPVSAQRSVAGILRVGGANAEPFSRDDLRLLESLGSLASLALDNSLLFNQVQDSALRDGLTGLITHKAFQDTLENGILEASRYNQPLSLILTDVDHFKSINDTYGHQAGDEVLQGFAHVLARNVRDVDVVSRYGGEEFIVLLYQTSHDQALVVAEAIRTDLEAQRFEGDGKIIEITGSFGVATFPNDSTSAQQLIRQADERLYRAKKAGRNNVQGKAA